MDLKINWKENRAFLLISLVITLVTSIVLSAHTAQERRQLLRLKQEELNKQHDAFKLYYATRLESVDVMSHHFKRDFIHNQRAQLHGLFTSYQSQNLEKVDHYKNALMNYINKNWNETFSSLRFSLISLYTPSPDQQAHMVFRFDLTSKKKFETNSLLGMPVDVMTHGQTAFGLEGEPSLFGARLITPITLPESKAIFAIEFAVELDRLLAEFSFQQDNMIQWSYLKSASLCDPDGLILDNKWCRVGKLSLEQMEINTYLPPLIEQKRNYAVIEGKKMISLVLLPLYSYNKFGIDINKTFAHVIFWQDITASVEALEQKNAIIKGITFIVLFFVLALLYWIIRWSERYFHYLLECKTHQLNQEFEENKRLTSELEIKKELSIRNDKLVSLGVMASSIAHEINNPIMIMKGHLELLVKKMELGRLENEQLAESLSRLGQNLTRVTEIIDGLRCFSRNGQQDSFVPVDMNHIIEESLVLLRPVLEKKFIALRFKKHNGPIIVAGRETQLIQVLINLLNNAKDAISSNEEKWIQLDIAQDGNSCHLVLTDSGHGIGQDVVAKMFEAFYTTKKVGEGTGLGLSISKDIIHDHRGELRYNQESKHTQFVISIPLLQKREEKLSPFTERMGASFFLVDFDS